MKTAFINAARVGVIGAPVAHSLSPLIHQHWLAQADIDTRYEKIEVAPAALEGFLLGFAENNFLGVNLTLPHKHAAYEIAKKHGWKIDAAADYAQSVNRISLRDGKYFAASSDGEGFWRALQTKNAVPSEMSVMILGAGGAAAAIACRLVEGGVQNFRLCNRTRENAETLAKKISAIGTKQVEIILWQERQQALENIALLIQASALGMTGKPALELDLRLLPKTSLVVDIVYRPLKTQLLVAAERRGNPILDGLGMLLYQAQPAFEEWFGVRPEIDLGLRKKLEAAL